jgi:outer membrane protein TolC
MLTRILILVFSSLLWLPLTVGAATAAGAGALAQALELAWQRAAQDSVAEARRGESAAARAAAENWFAEAPSLGLAQRDDRVSRNQGLRERELELALPLWRTGQRDATRLVAAGDAAEADAAAALVRLALAGELRSAAWAHAGARAERELQQARLALAEQLEADVTRREAAGDLARTDLLMAREDGLAAQAARQAAASRERQAALRWHTLTGQDLPPDEIDEAVATPPLAAHPRLRQAEAALASARAALQLARDSGPAPELSLGWQRSREDFAAPERNSLRIGLRVPLATESRNAPRIAAANTALIRAEAEWRRLGLELEGAEREAQMALDNATLAEQLAEQRANATAERRGLLQRAFELGELPLAELLRAQAADNEARLQRVAARVARAAGKAALNQARGVLP